MLHAVKRILLQGASPLASAGLAHALRDMPGWVIGGGEAEAGDRAWAEADVVILFARSAEEAVSLCGRLRPGQPAVLLISAGLSLLARRSVNAGRAMAHLSERAGAAQLRAAVDAVTRGLNVSDPALDEDPRGSGEEVRVPVADSLSAREREVFELVGKGMTNADIGRILGISPNTAKFHVAQILSKLGAASRAEAVHVGLRLGLIGF